MLNGQMATMDKSKLQATVLHELAHLKYPNHGPQFKKFIQTYG